MAESTNATVTITYDCLYRNSCSDSGKKCESCKHNPKRSYYEPVEPCIPYIPYVPYYPPYYPYYPYLFSTAADTSLINRLRSLNGN